MRKLICIFLFGIGFHVCYGQEIYISNNFLTVAINRTDGNFSVRHHESGKTWYPDPWMDQAAGYLEIASGGSGSRIQLNLSKSGSIEVEPIGRNKARIRFGDFKSGQGDIYMGYVEFLFEISEGNPDLKVTLTDCALKEGNIVRMEYPARHFSLAWERDRGMAVFPYFQGLVVPSYRFPMSNSDFGYFDDWQWQTGVIEEIPLYGWEGLSMPWFGIHDEKCAVLTLMPESRTVHLKAVLNYDNNKYWHRIRHTESRDPRILALTPVWSLNADAIGESLLYHFIDQGGHVEMAGYYREVAREKGLFVPLEEKVCRKPGLKKMPGAIYFHLYGGYPHYVNFDPMDFTFDQLLASVEDIHDNRNVENAIINIWGAYANYPPVHLPYNERAGGEEKLRKVYDQAKKFGYLITNYHSWHATLEHDPLYDPGWIRRNRDGERIFGNKWSGSMDDDLQNRFARRVMDYETEVLAPNLLYSDGSATQEVVDYMDSLDLPVSVERTGRVEQFVKDLACIEGMAPYNHKNPNWPVIEAPLFNLVYHDAIFTTNRWQSPDNEYDLNGDFPTRTLRNMLVGNMPMFVSPLWEYPGLAQLIRIVNETVVPWHREIAFSQLEGHDFLSTDMKLQRSRFANGAEVIVNFALCAHEAPDGEEVPGYGFVMKFSDGTQKSGQFNFRLEKAIRSFNY